MGLFLVLLCDKGRKEKEEKKRKIRSEWACRLLYVDIFQNGGKQKQKKKKHVRIGPV